MSAIQLARFLRIDTMGASVTMVLLGAATASSPLTPELVPGLFALAVSFHVYAYLLNDVIDLPIDRTDPRRRQSPLVVGLISRRTALTIALAQIPILVLLTLWAGGGRGAVATLIVLVLAVSVYDVFGKRFVVPPVTDLVQGVAWAALGWLAAQLVGGATGWTVVLALYFLAFIALANGVHGSIRDLENDRRHGARTTATWFDAQVGPAGGVEVAGEYLIYALLLQTVTIFLPFVPTALGWEEPRVLILLAMAGASLTATWFLVMAARATDRHGQLVIGARHLILVLGSVFLMVVARLPWWATVSAVGFYVLPFAWYRWLFQPKPPPGSHWTVQSSPSQ